MKHTLATLLVALGCLVPLYESRAAEPRPNIVFLLSDDQRADVLSCAGHPVVKTPHIDRLAAGGVRYGNAFVTTSICAASRATIFTGLFERTHGYTFGKPPVPAAFIDDSYPVKLREAGYRTGFFGKFGVQVAGDRKTIDRMFDEFADLGQPFMKKQADGSMRHVDDLITDRGIAFIRATPTDRPFCLSLSFNAGHAADGVIDNLYPYAPEEADLYSDVQIPRPKLDDPAVYEAMPKFLRESMGRKRWHWGSDTPQKYQHNMRNYLRMISTIDRNVGRVVAELEARGIADRTVILYMGDNGYFMGERGLTGKWIHYEESLRVPLIVFDPRLPQAKRGRVDPGIALNVDVAPTLLAYAGIAAPARHQGASLADGAPADRDGFFCEHRMDNRDIPKWEGVRDKRYVYANYYEQSPPYEFLHDLEKDPDELTNLVGDAAYADVLARMRARTKQLSAQYAEDAKPQGAQGDSKPRVLMIGDSISMGYHPHVVASLKDEAFVTRPKDNCGGTTRGVAKIDEWLKIDGGNWDVIHFNFGLHDLKAVTEPGGDKTTSNPDDPRQAGLETYEKNLRAIVAKLKATGAKLIFATTTPFPAGVKPHRLPEDAVRYNAVALEIMQEHGVAIDDLYTFALPRLKDIQMPTNVHFTPAGSKVLAGEVVKSIRAALGGG